MSDWKWLAEIKVPLGNKEYGISTGVPLSCEYILTTAHSISKNDGEKISVRFTNDFDNNLDWRAAKIIWCNHEFDAAVLKIDKVHNLHPFDYTFTLPGSTVSWDGKGFPRASKIIVGNLAGYRDPAHLHGHIYPPENKSKDIELTIEAPPKNMTDLWRGISGAPIVVDGRLVGIVKTCPENYKDRLYGVSLRRLNEDAGFRKLMSESRQNELQWIRTRGVQIIGQNNKAITTIINDPRFAGVDSSADAIIEAVLCMDVNDFFSCFWAISNSAKDDGVKNVVKCLIALFLPMLYPCDEEFISKIKDEGGVVIEIPVATYTIAEIVMAKADGRPFDFIESGSLLNCPVGTRFLHHLPEVGADKDDSLAISQFDEMLFIDFLPMEVQSFSAAKKRQAVNNTLKKRNHTEGRNHHYYYVAQKGKNGEYGRVYEKLKINYPEILFIGLSNDETRFLEEMALHEDLSQFLKNKGALL